jgi:hypothetical protein
MATLKNTIINDTGYLRIPVGTTAQRPASPVVGDLRYSTSNNAIEYYNGSTWVQVDKFTATGGSLATIGGYSIHTFTSPGTFAANGSTTGELLLIAGGGSGGSGTGAGGGAGGVIYNATYGLSGISNVTIGAGGPFRPGGVTVGVPGDNSVFASQTAIGGGRGGNTGPGVMNPGLPGGSGGGHAGYPGSPQGYPGARTSGTPGQGSAGGLTNSQGGGGGGGYGGGGFDNGAGGTGGTFSTSGSSITYAGGGAGTFQGPQTGGPGGGGNANQPGGPQNNASNYGSGGGGSWDYGNAGAGAGFQGLCIVRYLA